MTILSTDPLADLRSSFCGGRDYLSACTVGLPPAPVQHALLADLQSSAVGRPDPAGYAATAERARTHFARLMHTDPRRIAIGSQTSVFAGLIAAAVPDGADVVCAADDFSSLVMPFAMHARRGVRLRAVPVPELADAITPETWAVVFSIVQSGTGEVADAEGIRAAAAIHDTRTICDATQALGWLPMDADDFDAVLCHAYKWLCAPRGAAFAALSPRLQGELTPLFAGWYAGDDPWDACYGHDIDFAADARRFDVSPAWQAFVGAEVALRLFADADGEALYAHATGLAAAFRERMGIPEPAFPSAIVTWQDTDGSDLAQLTAAGITASGRAGRARVAFHVFNTRDDVDHAARALGR